MLLRHQDDRRGEGAENREQGPQRACVEVAGDPGIREHALDDASVLDLVEDPAGTRPRRRARASAMMSRPIASVRDCWRLSRRGRQTTRVAARRGARDRNAEVRLELRR